MVLFMGSLWGQSLVDSDKGMGFSQFSQTVFLLTIKLKQLPEQV